MQRSLQGFLHGTMWARIREIIIQTCDEMGVHIVRGVLAGDHVHMFLSIPPKLSLSDVMQRIKGRSSRRIQMEFPELRKRCWAGDFGHGGIFRLPREMSRMILSCSTWNYIPLNDATGLSRQSFTQPQVLQ